MSHSVESPTCLRAQHMQVDFFVAPLRWARAEHKQQLPSAFTGDPPERPQNQHTHSGLPQTITEYHLLVPQTAYPEGSFRSHQNMLGQILLCGVSPLCSYGQFSQQVSRRVNLTHGQTTSNQGSTMIEGHTQSTQGAFLDTRLG